MPFTKVAGKHTTHQIKLFTLSTCGWCRKTKELLKENDFAYEYIDVDKLSGDEYQSIQKEHTKYNSRRSFPTMVIDNGKTVITGYKEDEIREALL